MTDFVRLLEKWDGVEASVYTEPQDELRTQLASIRARAAIPRASQPAAARASAASAAPTPGATAGKGGGEGSSSKRKRAAPEQQLGTQGGSGSQDHAAGAAATAATGTAAVQHTAVATPVSAWTLSDVAAWVLSLGAAFQPYAQSFASVAHGVTGDVLLQLIGGETNNEDAHQNLTDLGVTNRIHRQVLRIKAKKLRATVGTGACTVDMLLHTPFIDIRRL